MKTILTYGTFDLLHLGHIRLLRRAKKLGDRLIVGLSTDKFNQIKHKTSFFNYETRKEILESIKYVDLIIPENKWKQKINDIKKYDVDVFVMGSDWEGEFNFLKKYCSVNYLERTQDISTTDIKKQLGN